MRRAVVAFETDNGQITVDMEDLDPDVVEQLAAVEGVSPWELFEHPGAHEARAWAILDACADLVGIDRPERDADVFGMFGDDDE